LSNEEVYMRHSAVGVVVVAIVVFSWTDSALSQESRATVRTYQGVSYTLADPSLEVFYTIGEPKEKKDEDRTQQFQPLISVAASAGAPAGGEQTPGESGSEKVAKLLRGHSRATEIAILKNGVEARIPWDRIRSLSLSRKPVTVAGLPPYVPYYRYSASAVLIDGARVDGDYVNLGTTMLRGQTPTGRVDIPWEQIEQVVLE
jgi:hypothetical protein